MSRINKPMLTQNLQHLMGLNFNGNSGFLSPTPQNKKINLGRTDLTLNLRMVDSEPPIRNGLNTYRIEEPETVIQDDKHHHSEINSPKLNFLNSKHGEVFKRARKTFSEETLSDIQIRTDS